MNVGVTVNVDHMCLDNQSHYILDVTELLSDVNESQSLIVDTIEMNEKYSKSTSDAKVSEFSSKIIFIVNSKKLFQVILFNGKHVHSYSNQLLITKAVYSEY